MKIHFRFFLSHDNSEKYQYFMKKVCILRKFRAKIVLKRRALRDVIMLLLMTSLAKERETAVKVLCNVCHIVKFMKWLYERGNNVIKVCILMYLHTYLLFRKQEVLNKSQIEILFLTYDIIGFFFHALPFLNFFDIFVICFSPILPFCESSI